MFPSDLAAVQAVPQSIPDVLQTLQAFDSTCIDNDGLKWFNRLYLQVTQVVQARLLVAHPVLTEQFLNRSHRNEQLARMCQERNELVVQIKFSRGIVEGFSDHAG